jgi:radical SAM protein with 4Fe4S-binding SPASM domain
MTARYARLTKDWSLRGWTDTQRAIVNWTNGNWLRLSKKEFYVAEACDGLTDFDSMAFLPEHHAMLDAMIKNGIAEACHSGNPIDSWQKYRKASNPFIKEILWCVTGLCNLNCRYCYMEAPSRRYEELSLKSMLRIIDQFEEANVIQVALTGGEPFLRNDLLEILAALVQKRIRVSDIYTNGILITDEILDGIKSLGIVPNFQISFDGIGSHDSMRGRKGIEKLTINAISTLRAARFSVTIAGNVDRENADGLLETYHLLRDLDVQAWRLGSPLMIGYWRGAPVSLSLDEEANAYAPLVDLWLKDGKPFEMVLGLFLRVSGKANTAVAEELEPWCTPESYDCDSIRQNPNLLPDGTLVPCPGYVDSILQERMPNILSEGLSKVWTESYLRTLVNIKKSDLLAKNEDCGKCKFFGNCGAGCRASALRETCNLMAKDPIACRLWKGGYKQRFYELADRVP